MCAVAHRSRHVGRDCVAGSGNLDGGTQGDEQLHGTAFGGHTDRGLDPAE
jgi:hypothetical protein